jgi:hypothetical protein
LNDRIDRLPWEFTVSVCVAIIGLSIAVVAR